MSWLPKFGNTAKREKDKEGAEPVVVPPPPEGATVLLLVEDEPAVRGLFAMSLRRDGYYVLEASNGAEALTVVEQAGRVDLVITDVVMPVMKGPELATRLREKLPDLRFIFVSGYLVSEELGPNAQLLQKPFVRQDLLKKVFDILGPATAYTA
jgi:two-component system cell cycle sensor histidine kinase/response regulator CckA